MNKLPKKIRDALALAQKLHGERIYKGAIDSVVRAMRDERGGGAPEHGHRPPGVVAFDDDVLVGGDQGRGRYRLFNFRNGITATDDGDRVNIDAVGGLSTCYDIIVNPCWADEVSAGRGTEGQQVTTFTGCTAYIYSTLQGGIDKAEELQSGSTINVAILYCGETTENVEYDNGTTNTGTLIIDGLGQEHSKLTGTFTDNTIRTADDYLILGKFTITGALIGTAGAESDRIQLDHMKIGGLTTANSNSFWIADTCIFTGDVEFGANNNGHRFNNCVAELDVKGTANVSLKDFEWRGGMIKGAVTVGKLNHVLFDTYWAGTGHTENWHVKITGSGNQHVTIRGHMAALSGASAIKDYILFDQGATEQIDTVVDVLCEQPTSDTFDVHYLRNADGAAMEGGYVKIDCGVIAGAAKLEDLAGSSVSVKGIFNGFVFTLAPCDAQLDLSGSAMDANCILSGVDVSSPAPVTGPLNADFFNGTFVETLDADVTEAGGVVTLSLQQDGTGDLTMRFSSGLFILDCTPAATIALTVSDDDSPQANYIYVLQSTKVLTKSTSQWPATEHIKVGYYLIPSAAFVAANGPYIQQQWNDHRMGTDSMGHMAHMAERERLTSARYFSGIDPNGTTNYLTIAGATVYYKATSGIIHQMHAHASPAVNTDPGGAGDVALVTNWNGDAFHALNNLFDIVDDSGGNTIGNNKWFNLVFWGVANKSGTYEPIMINVPAGFYNTQASAEQDISAFDNFDLPREFDLESSTAFLIARLTVQKQAGTWAFGSVVDLRRGDLLGARGGASSPETEFADNTFKVFDATDNTKVFEFQADQIAASTTRTLTVPDASGIIALTSRSDGVVPFVFYIPLGTDIDGAPVTP